MKPLLIFTLCLATCGYTQEADQREVLARLKALETEVAKRPAPVRWAYADRNRIRGIVFERSRERLAELKKAEALSPEVEAKLAHYEGLSMELARMPQPSPWIRFAPTPPPPVQPPKSIGADLLSFLPLPQPKPTTPPSTATPTGRPWPPPPTPAELEQKKAYDAMARRVAEAKIPVEVIVERRNEQTAKYLQPQFIEQLIADYVKQAENYDLVVDSSNPRNSFSNPVLFHTTKEVPDITEGIIQFFRAREKR